jgi:hypothetical protein
MTVPRWAIYRTADGLIQRHGLVDSADALGAPSAEEAAVEVADDLDPGRNYVWDGAECVDVGERLGVKFQASSTRADASEVALTSEWATMERTFTKALFFSRNPGLFCNGIGQVEATGGTVLIRMIEDPGHENGGPPRHYTGEDDRNITDVEGVGYFEIADTGGEWVALDIHSDQPLTLEDHHSEYRLEAKLGTATSGKVRAPTLGLLEARGKSV